MSLRARMAFVALALTCVAARPARAQLLGQSIEVFGTFGAVGGVTPVRVDGVSRTGVHAGGRLDAGLQFERFALAGALRIWEIAPASTFGGRGGDAMFQLELRAGRASRNAFRATLGAGFATMDGGHGPDRQGVDQSGTTWSVGAQREVIAPSGLRLLLSADLLMPASGSGAITRRTPVLEFGVGYRFRSYQDILPLPSGRR